MEQSLLDHCIEQAQKGKTRPFMENLLMVSSKRNELIPLRFNRLQDYMDTHSTDRDLWVKYRQGGSSLYWLGKGTALACSIPFFNFAVVTLSTDKGKTAERLFRHVKRFIDNLPPQIRPSTGHERADGYIDLDFMESQLYIGTVGSREFGRSETIHMLMITELGLMRPSEAHSIMTSAIESVPPGGIIVMETTPRFIGSYAHKFYLDCKAGRRPYQAGFVPWYWAEDYYLRENSPEALLSDRGRIDLTDEERKLASQLLDDGVAVEDRIRWRRAKQADKGTDFAADYPEDDDSCWLSATAGIFSSERLRAMLKEKMEHVEEVSGFRIYKEGNPMRTYVCGVDGAAGLPKGDFSAAVVLCVETGEVVATYQERSSPQRTARSIAEAGLRYGRMVVGGERDAWTMQVMESLQQMGYTNLYRHEDGSKVPEIGFPNTHSSRVAGVSVLRQAIQENDFRAYNESLILELMQYEKRGDTPTGYDKYSAPEGLFDDLCVAAQRAQQMRVSVPVLGMMRTLSAGQASEAAAYYAAGRW